MVKGTFAVGAGTNDLAPGGTIRQMQAILATGRLDRRDRKISASCLVIHGSRDPLLKPVCGKAVARNINGAQFRLIKGMGHDLPESLLPELSALLLDNFERAAVRMRLSA